MKCLNPTLKNKLNGQYVSFNLASYITKLFSVPYDCGKCIFCRKKQSLELARRCVLHASLYDDNCFLTLTYDESHVGDNSINYSDIQKFKKKLRQYVKRKYNKKIEIFNVHEYGKNGRKHWHLVIFNYDFKDKIYYSEKDNIVIYTSEELSKHWKHGYHTIGSVTEASAMYQAQYTQKDIKNGNTNNDKKAKSNHSGIGKPYFYKHYRQILQLGYIPFDNKKMPIPRYFQKLADRHYCHFYDQSAFFDNDIRKAKYRPFKLGEENKEIADLYKEFKKQKEIRISEMESDWDEVIQTHVKTREKPDFVKSGENALYDMRNKNRNTKESF